MGQYHVVLTFESVDKILWRNHSNETSLAVLTTRQDFFLARNITFMQMNTKFAPSHAFWPGWQTTCEVYKVRSIKCTTSSEMLSFTNITVVFLLVARCHPDNFIVFLVNAVNFSRLKTK